MKILITGGYGFIGLNLINYLIKKKKSNIYVIDNLSSSNNVDNYDFLSNITFIKGDCGDDEFMNNLKVEVDIIFHLAAQSGGEGSFDDTIYDLNTNSKATLLLLNFALRTGCKKIIFTSTCAVYGGKNDIECYSEHDKLELNTFYAINKVSSENYLKLYKKHYNINYTIFRLFNCYGPYQNLDNMKQGMVSIFLKQFISDEYKEVTVKGSRDRVRDLIYVGDVVNILYDSIDNTKFNNELVNLGTGVPVTVGYILDTLKTAGNFKKKIIIKGETPGDMYKLYANNNKFNSLYGNYKHTSLKVGIYKMISFFIDKM